MHPTRRAPGILGPWVHWFLVALSREEKTGNRGGRDGKRWFAAPTQMLGPVAEREDSLREWPRFLSVGNLAFCLCPGDMVLV